VLTDAMGSAGKEKAGEASRRSATDFYKTDDTRRVRIGQGKISAVSLAGDMPMNAMDFRRIALSLDGAEEGSHMGAADFRVGGRIFATLASEKQATGT
jgi:hypothetical protein